MVENLKKLKSSSILNCLVKFKIHSIINEELSIEISQNDLIEVLQFFKSNEKLKFRQLIDLAGVDYPDEEKRFQLVYLLLSHENNLRVKIILQFSINEAINSITKIFPQQTGWKEKFSICTVLSLKPS